MISARGNSRAIGVFARDDRLVRIVGDVMRMDGEGLSEAFRPFVRGELVSECKDRGGDSTIKDALGVAEYGVGVGWAVCRCWPTI